MDASKKKIAVILHGPPCSWKTSIAKAIRSRLSAEEVAIPKPLDEGWADERDFRWAKSPSRYLDLRRPKQTVLIVQVAGGEPPQGSGFPGATTGAAEWVEVLKDAGREILAVRVAVDRPDYEERLKLREGETPESRWHKTQLYNAYERGSWFTKFNKTIAELKEKQINTSDFESSAKVAEAILAWCDLTWDA